MQVISTSKKSAILALSMLFTSAATFSTDSFVTQKLYEAGNFLISTKEGRLFLFSYCLWLRLQTKGTSAYLHYKLSDWKEDLGLLVSSLNLLSSESRANIAYLFDKWIVGRQFSLWKKSIKYVDEDGRSVKFDDEVPKSSPFGLMGLFDAYVLYMLKKAVDIGANVATIHESCINATKAINVAKAL